MSPSQSPVFPFSSGASSHQAIASTPALDRVDPQVPLSPVRSLAEVLDEPRGRIRAGASLAGSMAVVVLLISAIGLYALMTAGAAPWRSEIGVRMAVGATRRQIAILVARRGLRALLAGVSLGVLAGLGTNRLLLSVYSVGGDLSPVHVLAALAVLVTAALPALLLPARRASLIDPLTLLKHE